MKVSFTQTARDDLANIGRYILEHNPSRAFSYMEELRRACLEIADMPEAFVQLSSPRLQSMRKRVFDSYLIFYTADRSTVRIIRIMHGARNYERILRRKPGR